MLRSLLAKLVVLLGVPGAMGHAIPASADPSHLRYYIIMRGVTDPNGATGPITDEVHRMFVEHLRGRLDIMLEAPAWLPTTPQAISAELARRNVRAYDGYVHIQSLGQRVEPVAGDASRRLVTVDLELQLFGSALPSQSLRLGGVGHASTSLQIGPATDPVLVQKKLCVRSPTLRSTRRSR